MIIFIIFVIGLVIILIYVLTKEKEEDEEEYFNSLKEARRREKRIEQEKILEDIRNKSKPLLNLIKSNYELKYCPKCFENKMELLNVSPTGASVEYKCVHCARVQTGKLLPNMDGSESIYHFNGIKELVKNLMQPLDNDFTLEDLHNTFVVNNIIKNGFSNPKREVIREVVRNEVWRREQGRCVKCGSQYNLEFDHIIPLSKGGSSTARNLQLLCETCNRKKSDKI